MVVLIDNYDSFTYNLVQRIGELDAQCEMQVFRNDQISIDKIEALRPDHLILSPGPCTPNEAGICVEVVKHFAGKVPIFGVCLGHQCIGHAFGADIKRADRLMHGKTSQVHHDGKGVFAGISNPFTATRYHSLIVDEATLPDELRVTARTAEGIPMAIEHASLPLFGVQFHPESILTEAGHVLLGNFLSVVGISPGDFSGGDLIQAPHESDPSRSNSVIHW